MALRQKLIATLIAVATVIGGAQAQGGPGGPGGIGQPNDDMIFQFSPFALVRIPEVATELKVTDEQKKKLTDMQTEYKKAITKKGEEMREKGTDWQDMMKEMQKVNEEFTKKLNTVLTADQQKRQFELTVQRAGSAALMLPEVQKQLAITEKQKSDMKDLQTKQQQANMAIFQKVQTQEITWEDAQKSLKKNTDILGKEMVKLLTAEQAAKYKAMPGKPFTFPKPKNPGMFGGPPMGG